MSRAIALVPACNEGATVFETVTALLSVPEVVDVVVIDDGSMDDTTARALAAGALCLALPRNLGKGDALNAGVAFVRQRLAEGISLVPDALLLADADLGASARRLSTLIARLDHRIDLVIADLPPQLGAQGLGIATALARHGLLRSGGRAFREPLSGQRAIAWTALPALLPFARGFGVEVAMTLAALDAGLRIEEVAMELTHRATRRDASGMLHRFGQARSITEVLIRHAKRRHRARSSARKARPAPM